jgi:hypothetical protein
LKIENLIKSGGGNGPVKPGNLFFQGAKSGVESKDEEDSGIPPDGGIFYAPSPFTARSCASERGI